MHRETLLEIRNLKTRFFTERGVVRAVNRVSIDIAKGKTLGILGESGCGKSVTALSVLRLVQPPGRIVDGAILLHRKLRTSGVDHADSLVDLASLNPKGVEIRSIRGVEIAMVFQEPMTFLNPVYTAGDQIMEAIALHQRVSRREARDRAIEMLDLVGMPQPEAIIDQYPHHLSGGMRQRTIIAMALSCHPSLLIADEPTTALDVTTEAQILELMKSLQDEMGMAIMYITHDLGVIAEMADEVAVMYLGSIVERAEVRELYAAPRHPYTQALLKSIPRLGRKSRRRLDAIKGMVPDPISMPAGCPFHPRCSRVIPGLCERSSPQLVDVGNQHLVRCFHESGGQQ